jgi:hypothetical protein
MDRLSHTIQLYISTKLSCNKLFYDAITTVDVTHLREDRLHCPNCVNDRILSLGPRKQRKRMYNPSAFMRKVFQPNILFSSSDRLTPGHLSRTSLAGLMHSASCSTCTAFSLYRFLTKKQITVLKHPPYSPHLSPCDFPSSIILHLP